jgi:hypothetical protein
MNIAVFKKILEHIKTHPEQWNQGVIGNLIEDFKWCGCFAGHLLICDHTERQIDQMDYGTIARTCALILDITVQEMEYLMDAGRDIADFEQFLKSKEGKASKINNFGLLENTIEERVTFLYRFQARKHGVGHYSDEDEYVESELKQLTRTEFLERISNAIEERLKEIK